MKIICILSERWNDDLLAGFDLSQKSKVKEVKEKSKEKREKIPGTDFKQFSYEIYGISYTSKWPKTAVTEIGPRDLICKTSKWPKTKGKNYFGHFEV